MYANNRSLVAPRTTFRTAGGSLYIYAHPFLYGQLDSVLNTAGNGDADSNVIATAGFDAKTAVDITSSLRLNDSFFNAQPAQDNSIQEVMVDGSTITITNHLMNGRATIQCIPGDGTVRSGDLLAFAPFIAASKDDVGGIILRKRFVNGKGMNRVFYGVSFANFPHDVDVGNGIPVYPVTMLYSGWFDILSGAQDAKKLLWAVGSGKEVTLAAKQYNGTGRMAVSPSTIGSLESGVIAGEPTPGDVVTVGAAGDAAVAGVDSAVITSGTPAVPPT
jgi:hypothetical protein